MLPQVYWLLRDAPKGSESSRIRSRQKLCDQSCSVSVAFSHQKKGRKNPSQNMTKKNIMFNRLQVAMRGFNRSGTLDCSDCSSKVHKGQQHEGKSKSYLSILTASIFDWQLAASQLVFICPAFSPLLSKTSLIRKLDSFFLKVE